MENPIPMLPFLEMTVQTTKNPSSSHVNVLYSLLRRAVPVK